jgi:hypothetical protein
MLDLLSKYTAELIIGAVFFILGAVVQWWLGRRRNTLDWELKIDEALVHPTVRRYTPGLSVTIDDLDLEQPRIVLLRIVNSGKDKVRADDYTRPITIEVPGAGIADAIVTAVSDPDVYELRSIRHDNVSTADPLADIMNRPVSLAPQLLNEGDWIELQLLVAGVEGTPKVSARFAGQTRKMKNVRSEYRFEGRRAVVMTLITFAMLIGISVFTIFVPSADRFERAFTYLVIITAAWILSISIRNLTRLMWWRGESK